MNSLDIFFYSVAGFLGIVIFIVSIWELFIYIRYSWARRDNENSYNGMEVAEKYFENLNNSETKVQKAFWRQSYVRYNKKKDILKLGAFDSRRKSLWTMASVAKQTLGASVIKSGKNNEYNANPFWFRIQSVLSQFVLSFLTMFSSIFFIYGLISFFNGGSVFYFLGGFLLFSLILLFPIIGFWKTSKYVINNSEKILGNTLSENEKKMIMKLWKIEYIHATVLLIKTILEIILISLRILSESQRKN